MGHDETIFFHFHDHVYIGGFCRICGKTESTLLKDIKLSYKARLVVRGKKKYTLYLPSMAEALETILYHRETIKITKNNAIFLRARIDEYLAIKAGVFAL